MKLYIGQQFVMPVLKAVTLQKARNDAAATLTASLVRAEGDTYAQNLSLALGDPVRLLDDEGTEVFLGSIHALERTPEKAALTAYDRGIFLTRNELHGFYVGSPAEIVGQVAEELGVAVGTLEVPDGWMTITARAGQSAFSILRQAVGKRREIAIKGEALTVTKSAWMVYPIQPYQVAEISGTASIGNMVNRCVTVGRNGTVHATAENAEEIARYGRFQSVVGKSGDAAVQAQGALLGRDLTGTVTVVPGHLNYRCGAAVELHRPEWGIDGVYGITAAEHRWEAGLYTTSMELEFIRE